MYEELHTIMQTKFSQAKAQAVEAMRERRIEYEARELQSQKNLLSTGALDVDKAIALIQSTRGIKQIRLLTMYKSVHPGLGI